MSSFKKALAFSFAGKYLGILLQLGSMIVLTRILSPEDYGVYTIAIVFVFIANILRDLGVSNYLIKEKELTIAKIRSAYSVMIIVAVLVATCLFFSAQLVADFYSEIKLLLMLQMLSLNILISPFGTLIVTHLRRNLNFKPIVLVNVTSQIISICTMFYFAYRGAEELTLVYGALMNSFCNFLFIQFYRPRDLPRLPGIGKVREILRYAKYVSFASIINQIGQQAAELVVGKHFDMASVGQLNRGTNTAGLFNRLVVEGLNPVLTPYISRLNRENQALGPQLKKLTNIQLNLAWPFYALLALIAEPAVVILYGAQWLEASVYLSILCVFGIFTTAFQHIDAVFMGKGFAKPVMQIQLAFNTLRITLIVLFIPLGIVPMLIYTLIISSSVRSLLYLRMIHRYLDITPREYLSWFLLPIKTTLLTITPVLLCLYAFNFEWQQELLIVALSCFTGSGLWLFSVWHQEIGQQVKPIAISLINKVGLRKEL